MHPYLSRFLIVIGCLSLVACSREETFHWALQSHATETSFDYQELVKMTDNIRLMSQGRLDITPHYAGQITGGADIYSAVKDRRVEMGNGWPNWWSGYHPAWAVMNAGPYEFMNIDASLMFFLNGGGTELANELSGRDGILWRPAWWPGMEFGLLSSTPILGLKDLAGKRVRMGPGLPSEVLASASGAAAIPLVPEEIKPALTSGDLDAVEWTTTAGAWDLGLSELATHAIIPAVWQPSVLADFLINETAYNELPPDLQAILMTAIRSFTLTTTALGKSKDIEALEKFRAANTSIVRWSNEDLAVWKSTSDNIYRIYADRDEYSRRLIESKHAFKQRYNDYYQLFGPYD
ncbi:TRAP transporter substrate-binding protein DctP [Reinekea sp. G2M2-21]|uniref:TRAP transporter substrate-binding protein DctP n=1 Tax=Reinekea sp. G2M2-21 TaxID=2788942 RepID=UPI0018ABE973|nr:TRAP transporter substrate-binding protein DctP [Reinekea sp. G2M2-21]